jgi:hypothetical protein
MHFLSPKSYWYINKTIKYQWRIWNNANQIPIILWQDTYHHGFSVIQKEFYSLKMQFLRKTCIQKYRKPIIKILDNVMSFSLSSSCVFSNKKQTESKTAVIFMMVDSLCCKYFGHCPKSEVCWIYVFHMSALFLPSGNWLMLLQVYYSKCSGINSDHFH